MHSADYAVARCLYVRMSVCPLVTRWYSDKTVIHILNDVDSHNGGVECKGI